MLALGCLVNANIQIRKRLVVFLVLTNAVVIYKKPHHITCGFELCGEEQTGKLLIESSGLSPKKNDSVKERWFRAESTQHLRTCKTRSVTTKKMGTARPISHPRSMLGRSRCPTRTSCSHRFPFAFLASWRQDFSLAPSLPGSGRRSAALIRTKRSSSW